MLLSDEEIEGLMRGRSTLDFGKAVQAAILAKLASAELPEPEVFDGSYLKNGEWEFEDGYTADQLTAWGNTRYAQGAAAQLAEKPSAWKYEENGDWWVTDNRQEVDGDATGDIIPLYTRMEASK